MNLAILFWFYKEPEICLNRLRLIKKHNPELKIYGLYGGKIEDANAYKKHLSDFLDDFYIAPFEDEHYKWIHGDLLILDWYEKRGKDLNWESIAVVQWDMLIFESLATLFSGMKKDQIYFSGLIDLDEKTEFTWDWTNPNNNIERQDYEAFIKLVETSYDYKQRVKACLFIFEIFPRLFLEQYSQVEDKITGMLEYKVPTYAEIFNFEFFEKDIGVAWQDGDEHYLPLNAVPLELDEQFIAKELNNPSGFRIFHPYFKMWE